MTLQDAINQDLKVLAGAGLRLDAAMGAMPIDSNCGATCLKCLKGANDYLQGLHDAGCSAIADHIDDVIAKAVYACEIFYYG